MIKTKVKEGHRKTTSSAYRSMMNINWSVNKGKSFENKYPSNN